MAEEGERFTIRELLRRGGYIISLRREKAKPEPASVEVEVIKVRPKPGGAGGEGTPAGAGEELKKKLDALVMKMVRALREEHGDVMLLSDFVASVLGEFEREHGDTYELGVDDVLISITELARKGLIAGVLTLDSGARIIRLSPEGFGLDELRVLDVVSRREPPEITLEELAKEIGWPPARARAALKALEKARVARHVPGSFAGEQDKWCFPGLEKKT